MGVGEGPFSSLIVVYIPKSIEPQKMLLLVGMLVVGGGGV